MVYREKSETRQAVEDFLREFKFETGHEIETLNPDLRSGANFCETYDIVEYPTLIAIGPDGTEGAKWRGDLPTISEVSFYA
jgi:hypothetical protein